MNPAVWSQLGADSREKFSQSPLIVIWEVSRACDLACVHCRATAIPEREVGELSTAEGLELIAETRRFGRPLFVFTGGDPLKRPDIFELVRGADEAGLVPFLSPSGTPLLTHGALLEAKKSGLRGVSISLDGSKADIHDRFRGVPGSFGWSMEGAASSVALGLTLQINTTLTRHNLKDLPAIADLVQGLEARRWTIFLLVPTGRGESQHAVRPEECEEVFEWLTRLSRTAPFRIKTTEGPHYRRVSLQLEEREEGVGTGGRSRHKRSKFVPGMNDGSGFLFISSLGEIQPSGFLPLTAGNVRTDSLVDIYRDHPLFRELRDPERLRGRCGACDFRMICGGSRARAFAMTGDYLEEDPACSYQPLPFSESQPQSGGEL